MAHKTARTKLGVQPCPRQFISCPSPILISLKGMRAVAGAQAESTCESLVLVFNIGKTHVNCISLEGRQMLQVADST